MNLHISDTTANNKKLPVANNKQLKRAHFTTKPPINVFATGKENQPPIKKIKIDPIQTASSEKSSNSASYANNLCNKYENCVFNGNIINNFYYSCIDHKNCEKKEENMQ